MTKEEVRVITISKLRLNENDTVLEIGTGTGSLTIEIANQIPNGKVFGIERNTEGIKLLKQNMSQFEITNIEFLEGKAPEDLHPFESLTFDKAVIGGSGGEMTRLFEWINKRLNSDGIIVVNTITIENTFNAIKEFKALGYEVEVTSVQISKSKNIADLTMMIANNPVYVITGKKRDS